MSATVRRPSSSLNAAVTSPARPSTPTRVESDPSLARRVEQQRVALLYGNTLAVSGSAVLMAALVAVIAWPYTTALNLTAWCSAVLVVQIGVQLLAFSFSRASEQTSTSEQTSPRDWGWRLAIVAAAAGVVWGSAVFVLVG